MAHIFGTATTEGMSFNFTRKENFMQEIYKDIKNYEGIYQISNFGNVRSKNRKVKYKDGRSYFYKESPIVKSKKDNGYLFVTLYKNNIAKRYMIHRLVAEHFISNPLNKPQVNHIDENKHNNRFDNLEWCTSKENMNCGTVQERNGILHSCKVFAIFENGEIREYKSHKEASKALDIPDWKIRRASKNKNKIGGVLFCRTCNITTNK